MPTEIIHCPSCGHRFEHQKEKIRHYTRSWVRADRLDSGSFDYSVSLPDQVFQGQVLTRWQQIGFDTMVGIFAGATLGMSLELAFFPSATGRIMLVCVAMGGTLAFAWSIDELKIYINRALPHFIGCQKVAKGESLPQKPPVELSIRHAHPNYQSPWYERPGALPVPIDGFDVFVEKALEGTPLVGKYWYPKKDGKLFSQREFDSLARLLRAKGIYYGQSLTMAGIRGFKQYLKMRGGIE